MRVTFGRAAVVLALIYAPTGMADLYTVNCLLGYDDDGHDKLCAVVAPELRDAVVEAQRKWRERNKAALVQLKNACQERLRKAYGSDTERLQRDRERVLAIRDEEDRELFKDPERRNRVNCRAYVKDFSSGGRVDIDASLIEETRSTPAEPMQWPSSGK
jgi:hypothetical protein